MADLEITRPGVVVPVRPDPTGRTGPTRQQARGRHWRRTGPGRYVPSEVDSSIPEQRIIEVAASLPAGAAITGWAALHWGGARWFDGFARDGRTPVPVPVALGDRRTVRPRAGVRLSEDWLFPTDVVREDGLPVTAPDRSVSFEVRRASSVRDAIRIIDMAAIDDLIDLESFRAYLARLAGREGMVHAGLAIDRADENVWSPPESLMRYAWTEEAFLPRPLCNVPIFDRSGRHLFTPDLFDPVAGIAGEYDGPLHLTDGEVRRRDLDREGRYREHGIEWVTMMSVRRRDTDDFVARLRAAYQRAASARTTDRSWTLDRPASWVDTSTVAGRRALGPVEREIWLRWRRPVPTRLART